MSQKTAGRGGDAPMKRCDFKHLNLVRSLQWQRILHSMSDHLQAWYKEHKFRLKLLALMKKTEVKMYKGAALDCLKHLKMHY